MPTTYEKISTNTLISATNSVSFNSIPSTFTDLKLVLVPFGGGADVTCLRFNSNSGSIYSKNELYGAFGSINLTQTESMNRIPLSRNGLSGSIPRLYAIDVFSYAGSSSKACLYAANEQDSISGGQIVYGVGTWHSTDAINSITIFTDTTSNFSIGSIFTLYGIKNA
jgi:hypothetical protein